MKKYTIKQPVFELHTDKEDLKRWYADNIEETLKIYFEPAEPLAYFASYCFEEYYKEDSSRFETFELAKEWLIAEFNSYVSRNLDEVQDD